MNLITRLLGPLILNWYHDEARMIRRFGKKLLYKTNLYTGEALGTMYNVTSEIRTHVEPPKSPDF